VSLGSENPVRAPEQRSPSALVALSLLTAAAIAAFALALGSGSGAFSPKTVFEALVGSGSDVGATIVRELRLPRAVAAFTVGALLSMAGALMQVLLRNPLADPYILGISGGAGFGALLVLLTGLTGLAVSGGAFGGALASVLLVFGLARGAGNWGATRLLLTGVVVAAGWGALISLLLSIAPEAGLRGMLFWLMGDLSGASLPPAALPLLGLGIMALLPAGRSLNLLARGGLQAAVLGVDVQRLQWVLYLAASLLTALAVTIGGNIGFVGLVVPHMLRLWLGSDHRLLLPAAALLGGTMLLCADTLARTVMEPQQLPVGVLTALIGVPLFLFLLRRESS
jgi:iron complex transport system permease protein